MKKSKKLILSILALGASAGLRADNGDFPWTFEDLVGRAYKAKDIATDNIGDIFKTFDSDALPPVKLALVGVPVVLGSMIIPTVNLLRRFPIAGAVITTFGCAAGFKGGVDGLRYYNKTGNVPEAMRIGLGSTVRFTGKGFDLLAQIIEFNIKRSEENALAGQQQNSGEALRVGRILGDLGVTDAPDGDARTQK